MKDEIQESGLKRKTGQVWEEEKHEKDDYKSELKRRLQKCVNVELQEPVKKEKIRV